MDFEIGWDRVVGVFALIGTLALFVLAMMPTESAVLGPSSTGTAPATSILGPAAAAEKGLSGVEQ